jgi:homoserine O-acetyltransferase
MLMTKALDYFDPAADYNNDLVACLAQTQCRFLVASFTTDWRFPPERSEEIVNALVHADKDVTYACIESESGHDAFLLPIPRYLAIFNAYMQRVVREVNV